MAATFYLSNSNSDLSGGADFNKKLVTSTESANTISVTIASNATETSYAFTEPGVPGTGGATGDYSIEINITTANADVRCAVSVARVNSSGTVQTGPTAVQTVGPFSSTGVYTASKSGVNLGTWSAGDRLRVSFAFEDTNSMDGVGETVVIGTGTTSEETVTPFTVGITYNDTYGESVTIDATLAAANTMPVTRSEAITPDVTLATAHTMPNTYSASITPDVTLAAGNVMATTVSEDTAVAATFAAGLLIASTVSFAITPDYTLADVMTFNPAYSESITAADDLGVAATYNPTLSESITPDVILNQQFDEVLNEGLTALDSYASSFIVSSSITEAVALGYTVEAAVMEPGGWLKPPDFGGGWVQGGGGSGDWTALSGPNSDWTEEGGGASGWQQLVRPDTDWTET